MLIWEAVNKIFIDLKKETDESLLKMFSFKQLSK